MKIRTPYSPDEKLAAKALKQCRFPTGSWDKRFVKQLGDDGLTEKERPQVWRLFIKYRRQIHGQIIGDQQLRGAPWQNLLETAGKLAAPDLRKVQAAANEQARIDQMRAQAPVAEGPTDSTEAWWEQEMHKEDDAAEREQQQ